MRAALFVGLVVLAAAGCLKPTPINGAVRCNPNGKACPDSYHCDAASQTCWRDGGNPGAGDGGGGSGLANGEACTAAGDPCASGHCVDGLCCDAPCGDSCVACNLEGQLGHCANVPSGLPRAGRPACAGSGSCAGTCDGSSSGCVYSGKAVVCGAACDGTCNGAGACSTGGGSCPGGYACNGAMCRTSCSAPTECQPNFDCIGNVCVRVPESDCLDGADNNGDGLRDCEDPTCNAKVQCVPGVAVGNEIGLLQTAACSGTDYSVTTAANQGLNVQACGACGCNIATPCRQTIEFHNNASCTALASSTSVDVFFNYGATCFSTPASSPAALKFGPFTRQTSLCMAGFTPPKPNTTWTTSQTYCGANRQSATCSGGQACVPKPPASTSVCVRVPMASQSCPAGYPTAQGTWYRSFVDDRACGCGTCTVTADGECPASQIAAPDIYLFYSDASQCSIYGGGSTNSTGNVVGASISNACVANSMPASCSGENCWSTIGSIFPAKYGGSFAQGSCSRPGAVTAGSAGATEPFTVCCQ